MQRARKITEKKKGKEKNASPNVPKCLAHGSACESPIVDMEEVEL